MSIPTVNVAPPADWVPVERRWFGLDRRTILPSLIALALIIVLTGVLPAINRSIGFDRETRPGDVIDLGSGVSFAAPVGWGFPDGILVSDTSVGGTEEVANLSARLVNGGVEVTANTGAFAGTADELLTQVRRLNPIYQNIDSSKALGEPGTITTSSGLVGVGQAFSGIDVEGLIAVFVIEGIGVEFVVHAPPGTLVSYSTVVADVLDTLTYTDPEA